MWAPSPAVAQSASLSGFFGFSPLEIIKIGRAGGPIYVADMNGDGLNDLVIVNNRSSRIELHLQKRDADPNAQPETTPRTNEFPEHWRYRRELISMEYAVRALVPADFDGDGLLDLVFAGEPDTIGFIRQREPGVYETVQRHQVRSLNANLFSFAMADVMGDADPELLAMVRGRIRIWALDGTNLGTSIDLTAGDPFELFQVADFNNDGVQDIAALMRENAAPLRLWLGRRDGDETSLGPQLRFRMPDIIELDAITNSNGQVLLSVIERASKRIALYDITRQPVDAAIGVAAVETYSFTDPENRKRSQCVADVNGDGRKDLVVTDTQANTLVVYRQLTHGFAAPQTFPCYADVEYIAAANAAGQSGAEIYVLSEEEGVVGRCANDGGTIAFPIPVDLGTTNTPVAMNIVDLDGHPMLAVITKDDRECSVVLRAMDGTTQQIDLGKISRNPETILALDVDQDDDTDLLLFTPNKPMMMLRAGEDGYELLESDAMGQFGLVQAATADNTAVYDMDGDGRRELLIADRNFIRAVRYDEATPAGVSPGWQVVMQMNVADGTSKLVSLATMDGAVVAADKENGRIVFFEATPLDRWVETRALAVEGMEFSAIHAGAFAEQGQAGILGIDDEGFAVIRLAGTRPALELQNAWQSDAERRFYHELTGGDINGDGFADMVALDAGEQMCELFTFAESGTLLHAEGFVVFESRLFTGGDSREFEPRQVVIADVTGDGGEDLIFLCHDRVLIYPQMTRPEASSSR
jgi:hypothetical protein